MPQLGFLSIAMKFWLIDETSQVGFALHWKQHMMDSLKALANDATWQTKVQFKIRCALYRVHPDAVQSEDEIYGIAIPVATFALCNGPDKDTFRLGGLDVKFLGVGKDLVSGDSNTQVILAGKKTLDG
jgi:hypothetical protein